MRQKSGKQKPKVELVVSGIRRKTQKRHSADGAPSPLWVYPLAGDFIASDDYFTLAACEQEELDYVPCLVLGTPEGEGVVEVQGPLTVEQIKRRLGFAE